MTGFRFRIVRRSGGCNLDIFRFDPLFGPFDFGRIVNGLTSKMWVERYLPAGEFTFKAPVESNVRQQLPIGTFITHIDTSEVMVVENHEITEDEDSRPELTITGRGLETVLEQRQVGGNTLSAANNWRTAYLMVPYERPIVRALAMINDHILASSVGIPADAFPYLRAISEVAPFGAFGEQDYAPWDELYKSVMDVLTIDDIGIKVVRPGAWSPFGTSSYETALVLHVGTDLSDEIIFSYDMGEIGASDYLWSNKALKNCAIVLTKALQTYVTIGNPTGYSKRTMLVDASDLDGENTLTNYVNDASLTATTVAAMRRRGLQALAAQKDLVITKAELSKSADKASYRKDFNLGDIITIRGDYNTSAKMRVSEYVEIEDENGESSYPTLSLV